MMGRKMLVWLVVLALSMSVAGLGGCAQPKPAEKKPEPKEAAKPAEKPAEPAKPGVTRLTIASGWVTGVYYPLAGAISRIVNEKVPNVKATVESSGAAVANAKLVGSKQADLAFISSDGLWFAQKGIEMFDKPITNIRGITRLYPEYVHIVARKASEIKSVRDLAGKRVAIGPLGSFTMFNAMHILEAHGLKLEDLGQVERIGAAEASDFLKDGRLDAAFFTTGLGSASVADLAFLTPITIVPVEDSAAKSLVDKYPFYTKMNLPAGVYKGVDADVPALTVSTQLACREDLPEDLVYQITKAIFENLDLLIQAHGLAKNISPEKATQGMPVPLHPGAEKYLRERGVLKSREGGSSAGRVLN